MKLSDHETSAQIEFKPPLPLCERVEGLHDHKGELEVHWIMQPTEQDMQQWGWLWKHLCYEPCTRHYFGGEEIA